MWYIYIIKIEIYHIRRSIMKRKLNPVGFLSCISIIALMGFITNNRGWFGFLGFLYYFRYFWIIPDESFRNNIEKSATVAFFAQLFSLAPLLFLTKFLIRHENFVPISFGISFCVGILFFTLTIVVLEWRESKGISND